jgi:hypothetical protein
MCCSDVLLLVIIEIAKKRKQPFDRKTTRREERCGQAMGYYAP